MLFSTGIFWLFFPAVLSLLWANIALWRSVTVQNAILLAASYVFYGWWDWRFLGLIFFSTLLDYGAALQMERSASQSARRRWLHLSVVGNLGILGYFKYFDFFRTELKSALTTTGLETNWETLDIILPVGISFYTLQTLSYSIDVYYGRYRAERNLLRYATYVAFFPQLVAGPIERAKALLPQFAKLASFSWVGAYQGVSLIIAGLFLKIVVADNLAPYVEAIYENHATLAGGELILGTLYFTVQIYADFCGYSSIAIGLAAIMGVRLSTNFDTPLLATSVSALWRGWNITLTLFFRDYVYALLRRENRTEARIVVATIATFFISGLWHGANWTFLAWGAAHGLLLLSERYWRRLGLIEPSKATALLGWVYTFGWFTLLSVLFRSADMGSASTYLTRIVTEASIPGAYRSGLVLVTAWLCVDLLWRGRTRLDNGLKLGFLNAVPRLATENFLFALALLLVLVNAATRTEPNAFIYFRF